MQTPSRKNPQLADSRKYNDLCVCQVCSCGRHHCPDSSKVQFSGETTNHHDYKPYNIEATSSKPCSHVYHQRHYNAKDLKTNYEMNYVPHKIESEGNPPASSYAYRPKTGKFYDQTEYKTNYKNNEIEVEPQKACSHSYHPNRAKFQGTTTYQTQFSPKKAENGYIPHMQYERKKVPFQATTTYQKEFKPHVLESANNGHQCSHYKKPSTKFEGESNYKTNYKWNQIETKPHCPVLDLPVYPRQCSPGKRHLNYSAEKNKWE